MLLLAKPPTAMADTPTPVWIDTDPAAGLLAGDVDDALALYELCHSPKVKIVGLSSVFGNAALKDTHRIATKLLTQFRRKGQPKVVHKGAASAQELGQESAASRAMARWFKTHKGTLLLLGPVTNAATMLKNHPDCARNIRHIIAVAGRRRGQHFEVGARKKRLRDLNFECDVPAFRQLLKAKVPITLAPWEMSKTIAITKADLDQLQKNGSKALKQLVKSARVWLLSWRLAFSAKGFQPFDSLAAALLTAPKGLRKKAVKISLGQAEDDCARKGSGSKKWYLWVEEVTPKKGQSPRFYCPAVAKEQKQALLKRWLAAKT